MMQEFPGTRGKAVEYRLLSRFLSFSFLTNCSEFLSLASYQLHLPLFNHAIDFCEKQGN